MTRSAVFAPGLALALAASAHAQEETPPPPAADPRIGGLIGAVSAERIEEDIRTLAGFGTRHTLSETLSDARGIGAARRWIRAEFETISENCGRCLLVFYQDTLVSSTERIPEPTRVVNVVAILPGAADPDRHLVMTGHYDSRASDALNDSIDAPGAKR